MTGFIKLKLLALLLVSGELLMRLSQKGGRGVELRPCSLASYDSNLCHRKLSIAGQRRRAAPGLCTNNARTAAGAEFGSLLQIERQLHVARLLMKLCIQSSGTMGKVNKIDVAEHSKQGEAAEGWRRQQMNLMTKWK